MGKPKDEATPLFRLGFSFGYTTYFRKAFSVSDPSAYESLLLRLKRDDGVIIYLNGVEVARSNMTEGPASGSTPLRPVSGQEEQQFHPIVIDSTQLRPGRNVIAVEVHDHSDSLHSRSPRRTKVYGSRALHAAPKQS